VALSAPPATRAERKALGELRRARVRRETGRLLVEGARLLGEALGAGLDPDLVAVTESEAARHGALLERAAAAGARVVALDPGQVDAIADREHGPGLLASVAAPAPWNGALPEAGPALALVLAGLQDPGNVGTLLRAARAFGARGVWLLPGCADATGPKVVRASAGAALHLPVASLAPDAAAALPRRARAAGLACVRAEPPHVAEERAPGAVPARALLVLGHETRGVPEGLAGATVCVPQDPAVESLNVAMAGSILLAGWYAAHRAPPSGGGSVPR